VGVKASDGSQAVAQPAQAARPRSIEEALERAKKFARVMDRLLGIPGSEIGIGLDALIGAIIPVAGDAAGGVAGLYIVWQAMRARVPAIVVARMLLNLALDALIGVVPVVGDIADVFFQANTMNLKLMEKHAGGGRSTRGDWVVVGGAFGVVTALFALPLIALATIAWFLLHWHR